MNTITTKNILIGVSGGIAAYKVVELVRLLKKFEDPHNPWDRAEVQVIMTHSAQDFIGKLTLATLSENPVYTEFFDEKTGEWTSHVELGLWADVFLIAPATANTISKMANGQSDNLLLATYLSARCPVFVAPAMDLDMWAHPSVQSNLETLRQHGVEIIEPGNGSLASGLEGKGRMEEPQEIFKVLQSFFVQTQDLEGKKVLVTLGPTVEPLDPVRFISNHSTGKMGIEIAYALAERGAEVHILAGPIQKNLTLPDVEVTHVNTALEMYEAAISQFGQMDVAILTAAVADYTPAEVAKEKIKKSESDMSIKLVKTKDIAAALGEKKQKHQMLIGFALETENEVENAKSKLQRKNLDAIVLNSLRDSEAGFGYNTNKITILNQKGETFLFETKTKKEVAKDIVDYLVANMPKS